MISFGHWQGNGKRGLLKARVAAYKMFGYEPDILYAGGHAITDGIDVISISMNSKVPREFIGSSFAIGTFFF